MPYCRFIAAVSQLAVLSIVLRLENNINGGHAFLNLELIFVNAREAMICDTTSAYDIKSLTTEYTKECVDETATDFGRACIVTRKYFFKIF